MLDAAILACLLIAVFQLVPLPAFLRMRISPAVVSLDRAIRLDAPADPTLGPPAPLAVDREGAVEWLVVAATVVVYFWSARRAFERGSVRDAVRMMAIVGGVVAGIALLQHLTAPHSLYWILRPVSRNAEFPFGPFVNRNDMAAWMVMGLPLAAGYMLARLDRRRREGRLNVESAFDETGVWLTVAICLMGATLVATLSRSGLIAGAAGAAAIVWLSRRRMEKRGRAWLLAGLSLVALVGAAYANLGALMVRVGETIGSGVGGRREIWTTTLSMIRDFPIAGVGVGSYQRAMTVYQPAHDFAFNHAHNEYLQVLAEGGVLMSIPLAVAIVAGISAIADRLRRDRTPTFWMRAGAASGLAAIAVQNLWETGLRLPANAVLCALSFAIAVHQPAASPAATSPERERSAGVRRPSRPAV
ncbi:MAG TPA: O-antigen ligase family protein [Vicinamibacterales bacterium]